MKGLTGLVTYANEAAGQAAWGALTALRQQAAGHAQSAAWPRADEEEWRRSPVKDFDLDNLEWGGLGQPAALADPARGVPDFLCRPVNEFETGACADLDASDLSALVRIRLDRAGVGADVQVAPSLAAAGLELGVAGLGGAGRPASGSRVARGLEALLARLPALWDNRFQTWNLAAPDVLVWISLPDRLVLDRELVLDWHLDLADRGVNTLVLVHAGSSSAVRLVERQASASGCLLNSGRYALVEANARLDWEVFQDLHDQTVLVSHGHACLGRDARHALREAQLGSGWVKARYGVELLGENSQAFLEGLYFGSASQHVDLRTVQNHVSPGAWSRAVYKGVVKDQARTIYQGLIHVNPQAPRTDAYLSNKNIILNDGARADSIPSLNIETDDVKCSHGSTTGRIDPEELYYLQNRGFSPADARNILVTGFLDQVTTEMSPLVRTAIQDRIARRIGEV